MMDIEVLRAEEEWQRAGAYSVRIQGMNRQYHISLRDEFDELYGNKITVVQLVLTIPNPFDFVKNYDKIGT